MMSVALPRSPSLPPQKHFYRRVLPDTCISFASDDGKNLFKESMAMGYMECYFKLAAQFRTQDQPAFCGLSTMVMVLNALEVDPGRVWKGPWRWYHENMLDCCVPLEIVEQNGINFEQFLCIASCNSLKVTAMRAEDGGMTIGEFRNTVMEYTQRDDMFIVLSYSRKTLKQTGDGHFSPIGGYHPNKDLVLILDTARFKYPPHWVPLELLYTAMKAIDKETGKPRGLTILSRQRPGQHLILFRLAKNMSLTAPDFFKNGASRFISKWLDLIGQVADRTYSLDELVTRAAQDMTTALAEVDSGIHVLTTQLDFCCSGWIAEEHKCLIYEVIQGLEKTTTFAKVSEFLKTLPFERQKQLETIFFIGNICSNRKCKAYCELACSHYIAFLLLSWPYSIVKEGSGILAQQYHLLFGQDFPESSCELKREVQAVMDQLKIILGVFLNGSPGVRICCKLQEPGNEEFANRSFSDS